MNQKGMTLIETISALALVSIIMVAILPSTRWLEEMRFNYFVSEIESAIKSAQQMAHFTNRTYTVSSNKDHIRITSASGSPSSQTYSLPRFVRVYIGGKDDNIGDGELLDKFQLEFRGDMSPAQAGTLTLVHDRIGKKTQITVRPVTGKTTIYKGNFK